VIPGADRSRGIVGYHASHEQLGPDVLLEAVQLAERAGFDAAMCSDHFYPWSDEQGESAFAWSWLGAAMQATGLPFGIVCAPGQRYHPAIIAQAAATLGVMFPDRFWMAVGSGQALNEHITGERWPSKPERNARLRESAEIVRALWAGETVDRRGAHVTVEDARLYTRPERPPMLVGAAVTAQTAGWVGEWADALITVNQADDVLDEILAAFRSGGGAGKPAFLQAHLAWAPTEEEARRTAFEQWRTNTADNAVMTELRNPRQVAAAARHVRPEDMDAAVRISADLEQHAAWIRRDLERFDAVFLHEVGLDQRRFVETFGAEVLPKARSGR